eukprot:753370-Hanusia_phi.AAC.2
MMIEGGSAFGELSGELAIASKAMDYVVPVTDNGGSSGELRRVFGGSAVGDIRSRLIHVAPAEQSCYHLRNIFQTRLDPYDESKAQNQMQKFCTPHADEWISMSDNEKLVLVLLAIFNRMAKVYRSTGLSDVGFQYRNSNFGNLILHCLKIVLKSVEEAIRWFCFALLIPETIRIFPCTLDLEQNSDEECKFLTALSDGICYEPRTAGIEIGAELENGQIILGQDEISHPPVQEDGSPPPLRARRMRRVLSVDKNLFGGADRAPPAKISSRTYTPCQLILYGPGSLFTSVMPSLILPGIGEAIAASKICETTDIRADQIVLPEGCNIRYKDDEPSLNTREAVPSQ